MNWKKTQTCVTKMRYYLPTLIHVPVNLFPRVFYWKFHFFSSRFFLLSIPRKSIMSGGKILQNHEDLFSHIFGTSWVRECGCKLSNKRVQKPHCLSQPCPLLFSPSASLDVRCLPTHWDLWARHRAAPQHTSSHTHTNPRKHTPRCCGSETQPACGRTLLRYASRNIGEGRAPPIDTQNAPIHLQSPLSETTHVSEPAPQVPT